MSAIKRYALLGLLLIAISYNALAFLLFERTHAFWLAYGATMLSFFILAVMLGTFFSKNTTAKHQLYLTARLKWTLYYCGIHIVCSLLTMWAHDFLSMTLLILVYLFMFVAYACFALTAKASEVFITQQDTTNVNYVSRIRQANASITMYLAMTTDDDAKKALTELQDTFRYSDPTTNERIEATDIAILEQVAVLGAFVKRQAWVEVVQEAQAILAKLKARNTVFKTLK